MSLRRLPAHLPLLTFLTFLLACVCPAAEEPAGGPPKPTRPLTPSASLSVETRYFIGQILERIHFNRDQVKPSHYAEVIPNVFKALDAQRLFLLNSDLEEFQSKNRPENLYWNLTFLGRLDPAFTIFERYEQRVRDRVVWIQNRLLGDFDFTGDDVYEFDRNQLPWPADPEAADLLWEARLKFELLQELLNDKPLDQAKTKVAKRYDRVLRNLDDFGADDVAEAFLTAVATIYDPHSNYLSPTSYEEFGINIRLQLFGIGALLGLEEDVCVLKEIIPGGPADLSRQLKPNDKIHAVAQGDGEFVEIVGMKLRRIVQLIRGEKGSRVRLLVQPADAADTAVRREITLVRDLINLDSARAHGAVFQVPGEDGSTRPYGVITLPTFYGRERPDALDQNSATADVADLIKKLQAEGIQGLVLDLRRNGGGLLGEAVSLAGLFIPSGPIVQIKNYAGEVKIDEDTNPAVAYTGPLVVLTSRFSASSSEIVAGALQNYGRAFVVGDRTTHGKGTVQTVIEMDRVIPQRQRQGQTTGASKVTVQKFYLPNGASTQLKGVVPDIILPSIEEFLPIGEQDLPHALPWDEISTSFFDATPPAPALRSALETRSSARVGSLPEFDLLRSTIERFKTRQAEKTISLNLETRRARKADDKAFRDQNRTLRRQLETEVGYTFAEHFVAPPPPPRIKAEPDPNDEDYDPELAQDAEDADARYAKLDFILREGLRVLSDLDSLSKPATVAGR